MSFSGFCNPHIKRSAVHDRSQQPDIVIVVVRYLILFAVVNVAVFPYAWETRNKGKGIRYELDP